ncbi:unnamed protein product [Mesocestoides corti]|uniref:Uncharacterized protein n=1 Tax=Mesocestoides corti TaxID=53468 RepID=A0A0R3U3G4_MESCO|nr:unnamed protein product [Mesocestoides corti]
MDVRLRPLHTTHSRQEIYRSDDTDVSLLILPYRSSTMPDNLSMRLKGSMALPTNGWLKRSPSGPTPQNSRLRCSRRIDHEKRKIRPGSMAPEVKFIDKCLPPPLPPKRTTSTSPVEPTKAEEVPAVLTPLGDETSEEASRGEVDVHCALEKITQRLDQLQVERSPVLGHYSVLYRLDGVGEMRSARPPAQPPQLRPPPHRPHRYAYTNLVG